jgi:outer membrane biosynthesis protein TonB
MPAKRRNFWILLSVLAVILAGTRWLDYKQRSCASSCGMSSSFTEQSVLPHIDAPTAVDREPIVRNMAAVKRGILYSYPCTVRRAGVEGTVVARVLVDENGQYLRHRIISRTNCGLAHRCDRFFSELEFVPAVRNHQTVPAWTNVEFHFPY